MLAKNFIFNLISVPFPFTVPVPFSFSPFPLFFLPFTTFFCHCIIFFLSLYHFLFVPVPFSFCPSSIFLIFMYLILSIAVPFPFCPCTIFFLSVYHFGPEPYNLLYKGGIAQGPYLEAHGGSTYCAVASLYLMDRLEDGLSSCQRSQLVRWLVNRQRQGLNGRPDKDDDTCYTFWIGK